MARKRASVKGKGADIYLAGQEDKSANRRSAPTKTNKKATFYLPAGLFDQLDDAWLDMRRVNRGLTKSELVAVALETALIDYAERGEQSRLHRAATGKTEPKEG